MSANADIDVTFDNQGTLGINFGLGGGVDVNGNLLNNIGANLSIPVIHLDPISVAVTDLPPIITTSTVALAITELPPIITQSTVALDLKVAVTELPKIKLEFGLKNMRIHLPTHYQFCFSLLGLEVFKFALCGESMVGIEPYRPHETEKCG